MLSFAAPANSVPGLYGHVGCAFAIDCEDIKRMGFGCQVFYWFVFSIYYIPLNTGGYGAYYFLDNPHHIIYDHGTMKINTLKIKAEMKRVGLTLDELGQHMDPPITREAVRQIIEGGKTFRTVENIATVLNLDPKDLIV